MQTSGKYKEKKGKEGNKNGWAYVKHAVDAAELLHAHEEDGHEEARPRIRGEQVEELALLRQGGGDGQGVHVRRGVVAPGVGDRGLDDGRVVLVHDLLPVRCGDVEPVPRRRRFSVLSVESEPAWGGRQPNQDRGAENERVAGQQDEGQAP